MLFLLLDPTKFVKNLQNFNREFYFKMQIESIEGFTEVCGRKKKNVKKLTAYLNIKKSPEEENNNLKDEGFATASPTESEESLGKS